VLRFVLIVPIGKEGEFLVWDQRSWDERRWFEFFLSMMVLTRLAIGL